MAAIILRMFSTAERPFVKPAWDGCIMRGIIHANLSAKIFVRIFVSRFIKEMGR